MTDKKTKLVGSVLSESIDELIHVAKTGVEQADVVELRVDQMSDVLLERLCKEVEKPNILTCRSKMQGGFFKGTEAERLALLKSGAQLEFDYVDVEIESLKEPFPKGKAKLILSHHDFSGVPKDVSDIVQRALDLDADVVKIAVRVHSIEQAFVFKELEQQVRAVNKEFAPIALGPSGVAVRILAAFFGADFTYSTAEGSQVAGSGQLALRDMVQLYNFHSIDLNTEIYGIVGTNVINSRSPAMHNHNFARLGRNAVYVPFQEEDLGTFVDGAKRLGVSGLSVTRPFKESIVPFLDHMDENASEIRAVNTIVTKEDSEWIGFNTDSTGVVRPLQVFGSLRGRDVALLGSGGAARAAAFALKNAGCNITVFARDVKRATEMAGFAEAKLEPLSMLPLTKWNLLVNATPLGTNSEVIDTGTIDSESIVFDMVTSPEITPLIRRARAGCAATVTGVEMLVHQALEQGKLWTGDVPSEKEFNRVARRAEIGSRYSRQILFDGIGKNGQEKIRDSRVLVVGVGALGSVSAEMLVRAGVAELRIIDRDYVDESNLQRQSLFDEYDCKEGLPKVIAAKRKLARINTDVKINAYVAELNAGNFAALVKDIDVIVDGTDNFETRYLLNDISFKLNIPWVYAACVGSYGMSFTVVPEKTACLRCLIQDVPAPGSAPTCETAGVIAPIVHAVAAFQITETLKLLSGREEALLGKIYCIDLWDGSVQSFKLAESRKDCPACKLQQFQYIDKSAQTTTLCGRNSVHLSPQSNQDVSLQDIAERLSKLSKVFVNDYLLRTEVGSHAIVLFRDGRAIIHGTDDPIEARTLYARYIGS